MIWIGGLGLDLWVKELKTVIVAPDMISNFYLSRPEYDVDAFYSKELPAYIRNINDISSEILKTNRLIIGGVSIGGFGATLVALHNPEIFKEVFSISGAFIQRDIINEKPSAAYYKRSFEPVDNMEFNIYKNPEAILPIYSETRKKPRFLFTCG